MFFISEPEPQIMEYQTQQYKLFPLIATVFATFFAAKRVFETFNEYTQNALTGNLQLLPEVNPTLSLLNDI